MSHQHFIASLRTPDLCPAATLASWLDFEFHPVQRGRPRAAQVAK